MATEVRFDGGVRDPDPLPILLIADLAGDLSRDLSFLCPPSLKNRFRSDIEPP